MIFLAMLLLALALGAAVLIRLRDSMDLAERKAAETAATARRRRRLLPPCPLLRRSGVAR